MDIEARLYYFDSYLTAFDARVAAVREGGWFALDRTAFYPTSGGQPNDTGVVTWDGGEARVTDVEAAEDGAVWHRADCAPPMGAEVHAVIDWDRRFDHMQQHAGDHLLAGTAFQLFGGVTIGLHTGTTDSSIDMTLPDGRTHLTPEETQALETLVNARVQRDDPIRAWFPDPAELETLPLRKRPTVTEHVRVVAMGDYEMVACGGTHPATTGQIGPVKILSTAPARGVMRLRFVAGMRAVRYFQETARCAESVAAALSAPVFDVPAALEKERAEQKEKRRDLEDRLLSAALAVARAHRRGNLIVVHLPFADPGLLTRTAAELIRDPDVISLLSCPGKAGRALVFARGSNVQTDMSALLRQSGARGGGKPDMAQGSAADGAALETAVGLLTQG